MSDTIPSGYYDLLEFTLSPVATDAEIGEGEAGLPENSIKNNSIDIKMIVHSWNIKESTTSGHVSGSAKVYDSEGVYYNYPIRGQEKLKISYKDFFGVERTEYLFVYSVTDIQTPKPSDDSVLSYTLHFVSWGKFWSDRFKVARCIAEGTGANRQYITVDQQVETLFLDYYVDNDLGTEKSIRLHNTDGDQKIVIPNLRPEAAMHLMSRKSYSSNFPSSYFRFFERRDEYRFTNMDETIAGTEPKTKFTYVSGPANTTPSAEVEKMSGIISLDFHSPVDTIDAIKRGAYYRRLSEVDITNRKVNTYDFKHHEEYTEFEYPNGSDQRVLQHTNEFINTHLNDWQETYVVKDYPDSDMNNTYGVRPKTYYGEVYNNKTAHAYDFRTTRMTIKVYGSNELFAGDLIDIELPYFSVNGNIDEERSGTYIIESIENIFYEYSYIQQMVVSKGPLNKAGA
jgi:hypothetical protein